MNPASVEPKIEHSRSEVKTLPANERPTRTNKRPKPAALVRRELEWRDLADLVDRISAESGVAAIDLLVHKCRRWEVVRARHELYTEVLLEVGSVAAVARIFGVDRSTIRFAFAKEAPDPHIVEVVMADGSRWLATAVTR